MNSPADFIDEKCQTEPQTCLPVVICLNHHKKIEAEKVDVNDLLIKKDKGKRVMKTTIYSLHLVKSPMPPPPPKQPIPSHPLFLTFDPEEIHFDINENVIVHKLWVLNSSLRSIKIICAGFWNDIARLGASWCCYPRTRIILAPGMKTQIYVKATPRLSSPVPLAQISLQLCASHMRDHVSGYFVVPIVVNFSNYEAPPFEEGE